MKNEWEYSVDKVVNADGSEVATLVKKPKGEPKEPPKAKATKTE